MPYGPGTYGTQKGRPPKKKKKGGKKGGKKWFSMANQPVDKSKAFVESGMTLITETSSDRLLQKALKHKKSNTKPKGA